MPDEPQQSESARPPAPPTTPGELRSPKPKTNWPTVLGVISIVFSALGLTFGLCGVFGMFTSRLMMNSNPEFAEAMPPGQMVWVILSMAVSVGLSALLLAVGIGLLQRRRWSITAGRAWAVLRIVYALVMAGFTLLSMDEQMQNAAAQNPGAQPAMLLGFGIMGAVFGVIVPVIYPVILLVWFSRPRIREEYQNWA